jgi:hypothetical protein
MASWQRSGGRLECVVALLEKTMGTTNWQLEPLQSEYGFASGIITSSRLAGL